MNMKNEIKSSPFISIKIKDKNTKRVSKIASRKTKRVFSFLQRGKFQDKEFLVCVTYSNGFNNKGEYENKRELYSALKAFLEKDYSI